VIAFLNGALPILQAVFVLAAVVGGVFVFRSTKRTGIIQIQNDTIAAMQQQIDALKSGQDTLQKENSHLHYVIETISEALKHKGILITVNGEMITLEDTKSQSSVIRRSTKRPIIKKEETL